MSYDEASLGGRTDPAHELYPGRRQLDSLSAAELRAARAWWFPGPDGHLSGPDDATVLPLDTGEAAADGSVQFPPGRYLLHAEFTLADGTVVDGHVTFVPDDAGELRDREPTLCTEHAQVPLWHGVLGVAPDQRSAYLRAIGKAAEDVFPLRWEATIHPPGDTLAGSVAGFAAWRDDAVVYL